MRVAIRRDAGAEGAQGGDHDVVAFAAQGFRFVEGDEDVLALHFLAEGALGVEAAIAGVVVGADAGFEDGGFLGVALGVRDEAVSLLLDLDRGAEGVFERGEIEGADGFGRWERERRGLWGRCGGGASGCAAFER